MPSKKSAPSRAHRTGAKSGAPKKKARWTSEQRSAQGRPAERPRGGRASQEAESRRGERDGGRNDRDRTRADRHDIRSERSRPDAPRADRADRRRDWTPPEERPAQRRKRFDKPRSDKPRYDKPRHAERRDEPARSGDRRDGRAPRREHSPSPFVTDEVLERFEAAMITADEVDGVGFEDLGLGNNITRALAELGAKTPFPIQAATIPIALTGRDVLGRGRTGSGKTIAFGAPLVERLMENGGGRKRQPGRSPRALILAPTRELALQLDRTIQPIARSVGLFTTQIYGGVAYHRQVTALQRGVDIVIGTPGRIEDLVESGRLDLSSVEITVLDEADHMCDLGFLEPVQRILRLTADGGQRMLFSATLDRGVATLVEEFLVDPSIHEVAGEDQDSATIDHRVLLIEQSDKRRIIAELASGDGKTLVFARTRAFAEELADELEDAGIRAVSLHGDLNQARRTRNLERLTSGRVSVLVATDVAARGIHVDDISLVVQADPPDDYKAYLHRAGRTGRAGKPGTVVTLVNARRSRRMDELLERAEITPTVDRVRPGDRMLSELAAL